MPTDASPAEETPFRILAVCIGNVCRSPVAERLLARELPAAGFVVASAGLAGMVGYAMSEYAEVQLVRLGGDPTGFAARQLTEQMVQDADLVLTATRDLRSELLAQNPGALRRTFTIREFAALAVAAEAATPAEVVRWAGAHRSSVASVEQDIADPFRRGEAAHEASARAIAAAVEDIGRGLAR